MNTAAQKILTLVGPLHIAGGLMLFAASFSSDALAILQSAITGNDRYEWSAFFVTVLGPTIASWGVLFTALTQQFLLTPSQALWRALFVSVLVWAPLDTTLCLRYGITIGVVINSIALIGLSTLLLAVKPKAGR